jgi:hypothetical protein
MSEAEFIALLVMAMGMQGYAVVEKVPQLRRRSAGATVAAAARLAVAPPRSVRQRHQLGLGLPRAGRGSARSSRHDLIVIPYRHDERQERPGVSPLADRGPRDRDRFSLTEFLKVFLDAGGIPPFALEYPEAIATRRSIDQMQEMWRRSTAAARPTASCRSSTAATRSSRSATASTTWPGRTCAASPRTRSARRSGCRASWCRPTAPPPAATG